MRLLIVKISSMGDILHTLPSLTDAIQEIPSVRFDWVVEENFSQIPSWHKSVNRVIPVAISRWRKSWFTARTRSERRNFRESIQTTYYDAIIDAQGLLKSAALVTQLAHGTKHGMNWKSAREPLASFFYKHRHYIKKQQHAVERNRELFAKSLGYRKPETRGDYGILQRFLHASKKNKLPYVIFFHATSRNNKHWPESNWYELINLLKTSGLRIKLPWGAPHEKERAKRLAKEFHYVDVLPRMKLDTLAQKIINAEAVVSVDTGLSHLTAALDRPNITLYGPTDPSLIGVYGNNQYICRPLYSSRLRNLSSTIVFMQLKSILKEEIS